MVMRILYVNLIGDLSGAENSLLSLITHLDKARFQPLLVCSYSGVLTEMAGEKDIPVKITPITKVSFSRSPLVLTRQLSRLLVNIFSALKFLQEEQIDLVHINTYKIALPYTLAARLAGISIVWHLRDILDKTGFKRFVLSRLFRLLPDRLIAVSDACVNQFEINFKGKMVRVYNGIDADAFREKAKPNIIRKEFGFSEPTRIVGCVGQLISWKGQDVFLRAMARVVQEMPNTKFLIVGDEIVDDNPFRGTLDQLVSELGLEDKVIFTGFRLDIPSLIAAMDIFVHCPVKPDPLPRVILEAMALSLPIVATHTGGIPELVKNGENGLLVPPADEKALANGVLWMISNPTRAKCLGKEGRHLLQGFSTQQHVDQVMTIYNNLMNGASTH